MFNMKFTCVPIKSNAISSKKNRLSCYCLTNLLASQFNLSFIKKRKSPTFSVWFMRSLQLNLFSCLFCNYNPSLKLNSHLSNFLSTLICNFVQMHNGV